VNGKNSGLQIRAQPPFKRPPFGRGHPEVTGAIACPSSIDFNERVDIVNMTERQKLVSNMADAPTHALAVVLKCAVCLVLLTLLVVIGSTREEGGVAPEARGSAPHALSAAKLSGAAAHRKEVFDERRARFAGNAPERHVAGTAPVAGPQPYVP
jgi:hypothetical protein